MTNGTRQTRSSKIPTNPELNIIHNPNNHPRMQLVAQNGMAKISAIAESILIKWNNNMKEGLSNSEFTKAIKIVEVIIPAIISEIALFIPYSNLDISMLIGFILEFKFYEQSC